MLKNTFKPGDKVPKIGSYWVHHYQHRKTHLVQVALARFPECLRCNGRTRFESLVVEDDTKPSTWLRFDPDFTGTAKDIPLIEGATDPIPSAKSGDVTPRPKLTLIKGTKPTT
jgi:hypothetical protein